MKTNYILTLIFATLMLTTNIKAQESRIITGYRIGYNGWQPFSKEAASALFIQERARIAFPNSTERDVRFIKLTEESAQQMGMPVIGVVFVNNADIIQPSPFSEKEPATLEIFPFLKSNIYFCKHHTPQQISGKKSMKMYDDLEREINRILENPQGDTIFAPNRVDSRYTPLLIKNLSNDSEIYLEGRIHNSGYKIKKRFFGLIKKKEYAEWDETYYEPVRMSDFARKRLKEIFRSIYWSFDFPKTDAPAEEWQTWLDELLKTDE